MIELRLMVEGQEGVSWQNWLDLAETCEEAGVPALFRSDHYLSTITDGSRETLDAWATIAALAARTRRLRLGTMVSPVTLRYPSELAKSVVTADHVSGGRVELGLGAGWNEREHAAFGFPFPGLGERMELLEEQLEIVTRLWTEERVTFTGRHYRLDDAPALPKPVQQPRPPLIMGGQGGPRAAALAARFADEYNTFVRSLEDVAAVRARLREACERAARDPDSLVFSVATGVCVGEDEQAVLDVARRILTLLGRSEEDPAGLVERRRENWVVGTAQEARARLQELEALGVRRVYLQHLAHEDLELVRFVGSALGA